MAKVCDIDPCDTMQRTIDHLARMNDEHPHFELLVSPKKGVAVLLRLVYCPFCGTRIDERWTEEVRNRGRLTR